MQKNQVLTLTADTLGAEMEGVCRADGMAVFVPGLLPGETANVRIVKVEKRYAFGRMESKPVTASEDRCQPDCPVFPRCGGCSCRHMTYAATLEAKRKQVEDCFKRIGHLDVTVPPVLGMEEPSHYRNKTALPVGGTVEQPQLGFFAPRSHTLIPVTDCPNAMPPANELAAAFLDWMRSNRVAPYDETTHTGLVRHLVIRVNRKHEAMVTVVVNGRSLPDEKGLAAAMQAHGAVSVILNENRERTNVILGRHYRTIAGSDTLGDVLCGLSFELSPAAFFQVNPVQTEKLYQTALDFAELDENDTLCDVYCGAGTITLMMARHCKKALGIEIVPQAIDNARENAARNQIKNADFRVGAAEAVLPELVKNGLRPDVIVVDPPRKGLEPAVIDAMAAAQPKRIVYVSCNVATQARDAALLDAAGYHVQKVQPVDMFCWTSGVETVILLSQQKPDDKIRVGIDLKPEDVTAAESKATYAEIQGYIEEKYGFKVSTLYIAQTKEAMGIKERENYNQPKSANGKKLVCPPEKKKAIQDALRHFKMI